MNRISSNIKKQRTAEGISRRELAESLGTDEKTVEMWENGKLLPGVDTIKLIAEKLNTGAEKLIYGKKLKVQNAGNEKSVLTIVLTIMGSLLTVAGLVILFVNLFEKLEAVKEILSFFPLTAGFGFACFAGLKKSNSVVWRESGAAVWSAGSVITLLLLNGSLSTGFEADVMLIFVIVSLLPVLISMKAIVPYLSIVYAVTHLAFYLQTSESVAQTVITSVIHIAALACGILFLDRAMRDNAVKCRFMKAVTGLVAFVSAVVHLCIIVYNADSSVNIVYFLIILLSAVFSAALVSGELPKDVFSRFCEACLAVAALLTVFIMADGSAPEGKAAIYAAAFVFAVLLFAASAVYSHAGGGFSFFTCVEAGFPLLSSLLILVCAVTDGNGFGYIVCAMIISIITGILIIVSGVRSASLAGTNIGMISVCADALFLIVYSDAPVLFKGLSVMAAGILVLLVNAGLIRSSKKEMPKEDVKDD